MGYFYAWDIGNPAIAMSANAEVIILEVEKEFIREPTQFFQGGCPEKHKKHPLARGMS